MLPTEFPPPTEQRPVEVHAVLNPAQEVGGDLYDVFEVGPDTLCVAVGDVSGKGVPAALFMARTRSLLRAGALQFFAAAGRPPRPSELAVVINEELCKNNAGNMFVTLFLGFLDLRTGVLAYVSAGHVPPFRLRGGTAMACESPADLPMGAMEGSEYADATIDLVPGDGLVVISDGVLDIENAAGEDYALERVLADLAELSNAAPSAVTREVLARALGFANGVPQFDDVTVLALRFNDLKKM
jgi:serine phosphatase RsbU (regulator of sigma subunit)